MIIKVYQKGKNSSLSSYYTDIKSIKFYNYMENQDPIRLEVNGENVFQYNHREISETKACHKNSKSSLAWSNKEFLNLQWALATDMNTKPLQGDDRFLIETVSADDTITNLATIIDDLFTTDDVLCIVINKLENGLAQITPIIERVR